jgi:hypothetical protein
MRKEKEFGFKSRKQVMVKDPRTGKKIPGSLSQPRVLPADPSRRFP